MSDRQAAARQAVIGDTNAMSETRDSTIETVKRRKALAKPKGRVTMTDIARAAGCSQATVSFVLNNSPGIKLSLIHI